jgi:isochorismate synthase
VSVTFGGAPPPWPSVPLPNVRIAETLPAPQQHRARIRAALDRLNEPGSPLQKVVLARALRLVADGALDLPTILHRLSADPEATVTCPTDPAGRLRRNRPGGRQPGAAGGAPGTG